MKINLLFFNGEKIEFNKNEIEQQVKEFNKVLNTFTENKENTEKDKINKITLLMKDLGYDLNSKEVQNIINKKNPSNEIENIINNLSDVLDMFLKRNKPMHRGNFSILFQMIDNDENNFESKPVFRTTNEIILFDKNNFIKVQDFNKVNAKLDQFIEFINQIKEKEISPLIGMHIINIHSLLLSPFNKYNLMLSKILSMWYLNIFENDLFKKMPSDLYLDVIQKNKKRYQEEVKSSFETGDYTNFVSFLINKMSGYLDTYNLNKKIILYLKNKYKKFLANHEKKFLFMVLLSNLNEFDWKLFKKFSQLKASKQYIIYNLSKLEKNFNLLKSKKYKNRKFFIISQHLKKIIKEIKNDEKMKKGVH